MEYSKVNPSDEDWDSFVLQHPHGSVFQTSSFYRICDRTNQYQPVRIALQNSRGDLSAVLQGVTIREFGGPLRVFSSRSIVQGGPLVQEPRDPTLAARILKEYDDQIRKEVLFTEIRHIFDTAPLIKEVPSYRYNEHLNLILDLNGTREDLWNRLNRNRRRNIRQNEKVGVTVEEIEEKCLVTTLYSIIQENYRRTKIPLADRSLFEATFDVLVKQGRAKFLLASYKGDYIGAKILLLHNRYVYDWYVGSLTADPPYVQDSLFWYGIQWSREHQYTHYDFGGAGRPDKEYGVRDYKKSFGGTLVNYGRNIRVYSPVKCRLTRWAYRMQQWISRQKERTSGRKA
jgi:serine/alanine adding enzyme